MIVTVQETIEHSRDITPEMVEAYIVKHGWAYHETSQLYRWYYRADSPPVAVPIVESTPWLGSLKSTIAFIARYVGRGSHLVLADIADGDVGGAAAPRRLDATPLTDTVDELLALRKQAALDRQSREASQIEFARLNRELNEAKENEQVLGARYDEVCKALNSKYTQIAALLGEIASTAIAAGMMDPARRWSLDGPNAIQFLRLMTEQYEAMK